MMKCLAGRHIHFDFSRLIYLCLVLKFYLDHQVNNSMVAHDTFTSIPTTINLLFIPRSLVGMDVDYEFELYSLMSY